MDNTETVKYADDFPEGLVKFCEAYDKKHGNKKKIPSINHNLYLIQTTDIDGNITGEAYGMNLMTDTGFKAIYKNTSSYSNRYIYIGNGSGEPSLSDTTLFSPIITTGTTHQAESSSDYYYTILIYGMTYDSTNKIASVKKRMYKGYFDYNVSGITEDVEITELGYGTAYNNLHTHALIYDADGNQSSITKRLNDRMTITMFWSISFKPEWITSLYDRGIYTVFDPAIFLQRDSGKITPALYYQPSYADNTSRGSANIFYTDTYNTLADCVMTSRFTIGSRFLDGNREYMSNILLASGSSGNLSYFVLTHDKMQEPEEIVCDTVFTNSYSSTWLTNLFGYSNGNPNYSSTGMIPATNFDIKSLYMYNHLTKAWDIEETFENNPNYEYIGTTYFYVGIYMYLPMLNESQTVYVYINTRTDLPINSFGTTGMTLYATDEYWNTEAWTLIDNTSSVPTELQSKRYYVRLDGPGDIKPSRTTVIRHQILTNGTMLSISLEETTIGYKSGYQRDVTYYYKPLSNDDRGWISTFQYFVFPDTTDGVVTYPIMSDLGSDIIPSIYYRWNVGDRFIVMRHSSSYCNNTNPRYIRIHDLSQCPDVEPTKYDITTITSFSNETYCTFTENGYLVMQSNDSGVNIAEVLCVFDEDGTFTQYQINDSARCAALNLTDNCVYLVAGDNEYLTFNIFDMRQKSVIDTFSLPVSGYTLEGLCGWREFVYIRVGLSSTYSTYVYNTNEKQLTYYPTLNDSNMNFNVGSYYYVCSHSNSECFILKGSIFTPDHIGDPISIYSGTTYGFTWLGSLKYVNEGRQLLFTGGMNYKVVVDVGKVIDEWKSQSYIPVYNFPCTDSGTFYPYVSGGTGWTVGLYKKYIFMKKQYNSPLYLYPIESFVAHKMTGTTYTIQSYNNPKQVGSKTYEFNITNDTSKWDLSSS